MLVPTRRNYSSNTASCNYTKNFANKCLGYPPYCMPYWYTGYLPHSLSTSQPIYLTGNHWQCFLLAIASLIALLAIALLGIALLAIELLALLAIHQ